MPNANPQDIRSHQPEESEDNKSDQRNQQRPTHVLHTVPPIGSGNDTSSSPSSQTQDSTQNASQSQGSSSSSNQPSSSSSSGSEASSSSENYDNVTELRHGGARGTAAMDPHTRQEVARKGGLAVSRNKQHMAEIGRKGGQSVSKNREHMAKIGRKGGAASRGQRGSGEGSSGSSSSGQS